MRKSAPLIWAAWRLQRVPPLFETGRSQWHVRLPTLMCTISFGVVFLDEVLTKLKLFYWISFDFTKQIMYKTGQVCPTSPKLSKDIQSWTFRLQTLKALKECKNCNQSFSRKCKTFEIAELYTLKTFWLAVGSPINLSEYFF